MQRINAPFEEYKIIGSHTTNVFPFVIWVMFNSICATFAVWIDKCDRKHVILGVNAPKIAEREWPLQCRNGYGSP